MHIARGLVDAEDLARRVASRRGFRLSHVLMRQTIVS